jgi:hypothetical protein
MRFKKTYRLAECTYYLNNSVYQNILCQKSQEFLMLTKYYDMYVSVQSSYYRSYILKCNLYLMTLFSLKQYRF